MHPRPRQLRIVDAMTGPDHTDIELPQRSHGCPGTCSAYCRSQESVACVEIARSRAVRWWLAAMGVVSVGLGGLGVIVPGLPTTVFLLIASWCFVRSCPALERVLVRNRFFGPFLKYTLPGAVMPTRARVISTVAIWSAILLSGALLVSRGTPVFVLAIIGVSGVVGTVAVWRIARGGRTGRTTQVGGAATPARV